METGRMLLLSAGVACIIAAIIGGGLKAFNIEFPLLQSLKRQVLLAVFGIALGSAYFLIPPSPGPTAQNNGDPATPVNQDTITITGFVNNWKGSLENGDIKALMNQSDYPFSFENEFVGNPERLEEKYSEFLKKYDANGLKNMNTMVFGGGKIGDSTVMYKGYLNEAFTSSREEILKKLAINTVFQDTDYFMLWVYYREQAEPASLPNSLQCSILVRKSGSEYKVIAFVYE